MRTAPVPRLVVAVVSAHVASSTPTSWSPHSSEHLALAHAPAAVPSSASPRRRLRSPRRRAVVAALSRRRTRAVVPSSLRRRLCAAVAPSSPRHRPRAVVVAGSSSSRSSSRAPRRRRVAPARRCHAHLAHASSPGRPASSLPSILSPHRRLVVATSWSPPSSSTSRGRV